MSIKYYFIFFFLDKNKELTIFVFKECGRGDIVISSYWAANQGTKLLQTQGKSMTFKISMLTMIIYNFILIDFTCFMLILSKVNFT